MEQDQKAKEPVQGAVWDHVVTVKETRVNRIAIGEIGAVAEARAVAAEGEARIQVVRIILLRKSNKDLQSSLMECDY